MDLKKWNPKKEKLPFASLFIGSRRSGKSTLIRHLYETYWVNKFDTIIVMCGSNYENFFQEFIFGELFFDKFEPVVIMSVMEQQKARIREGKKPFEVLLILDDCSDDREKHSDLLQKIYTRGRHLNISIIFSTQETTLTGTVARNNSDFIVIGRQYGGRGRDNIVENFLLGQPETDDIPKDMKEKQYLRQLLKKNTEDHKFMVLSFSSELNDFKNTVFKYKVDLKAKKKKPRAKKPKKEMLVIEEVIEE